MIIISIGGPTAAGKTSVAEKLLAHFTAQKKSVIILPCDNYFKTCPGDMEARQNANLDHPERIEFSLLVEHLQALKSGETIQMPSYDFSVKARSDKTTEVKPVEIVIVEGILVLHAEALREMSDVRFYVNADQGLCLPRRMRRDVETRFETLDTVLVQWEKYVYPMYRQFVEPSQSHADFVVENDSPTKELDITTVIKAIDQHLKGEEIDKLHVQICPHKIFLFGKSLTQNGASPSVQHANGINKNGNMSLTHQADDAVGVECKL